jgi:hypothetical protein
MRRKSRNEINIGCLTNKYQFKEFEFKIVASFKVKLEKIFSHPLQTNLKENEKEIS